ncbi:MAG: polysaccharide deacetylase family protein [Candidatus Bathyarchaeota archaeon]|nr:polysaccharide deacetylase family protein [Candidatus Bathyarchaeota archaeon]
MKVAVQAVPADAAVISELLSPWNVTFTEPEDADVSIVYRQKPIEAKSTVIIPSESESFKAWARNNGLKVTIKPGNLVYVPATSYTTLSITPNRQYCYDLPTNPIFDDSTSTDVKPKECTATLKINAVKEFNGIVDATLNPKQAKLHRLFTGLPVPYGLVPARIRNFMMRTECGPENLAICDKLPLDALRYMLSNAIENASGKQMEKKPIFLDNYVCLLTHDVETAQGLQKARFIKKIEEKYDTRSAWFLPSKRYKLNDGAVRELANNGEVGAHDTKHDGKLAHLPKKELVERFSDVKHTLGTIIQQPVEGFRAPILQHNPTILQALNEAGYTYDTSIPAWEPKHPYTMKPHGIGTVYPLTLNGLMEIPLTLPQDHQLLYVLGLKPEEALKIWAVMASVIRDLGGICMFLVHPDYEFGNGNTSYYEELIGAVTEDPQATITLPSRTKTLINEYS